jgi:hypothetical protein
VGLADAGDTEGLKDCLPRMRELVSSHPTWLYPAAQAVLEAALRIAEHSGEEDLQKMAFEFLVAFSQKRTNFCMKIPGLPEKLLELCVRFMLQFEEDPQWATNVGEDDLGMSFDIGSENIDRLSKAFGHDVVGPIVFRMVGHLIAVGYRDKVVACEMLFSVAEHVTDEGHVDQMLQLLVDLGQNENPMVSNSALKAIGEIGLQHQPYVQEKHGDALCKQLIQRFDDPSARVKAQACKAFVNVVEGNDAAYGVAQEAVLGFAEPALAKLVALLPHQFQPIQESVLTAIAVIAASMENNFVPAYPHVFPALKQVILSRVGPQDRLLRGKAFECASIIFITMDDAVWKADAAWMMETMLATLAQGLAADDQQKSYIDEALSRMVTAMKADFVPYLPALVERSLTTLAIRPSAVDEGVKKKDATKMFLQDGTCVGLKTSELEDIKAQLGLLKEFADELGAGFFDFVPRCAEGLFAFLDFALDHDVRELAIDTWAELLKCTREGLEKQGNPNHAAVEQMLRQFVAKMAPVLSAEKKPAQVQAIASGTASCARQARNALKPEEVQQLVELVLRLVQASFERCPAVKKDDEDDQAEADEERQSEEDARLALCDVAAALMETHKEAFVQAGFQPFTSLFMTLLSQKEDETLPLSMASAMLQHLGDACAQAFPTFLPRVLEGITKE